MKTQEAVMHFALGGKILDRKKMLLGSHAHCDLKFSDASVSEYHAIIVQTSEGMKIKDLYSEEGVYVNGRRIEECLLKVGDTLTLGTVSFVFEAHETAITEVEIAQADELPVGEIDNVIKDKRLEIISYENGLMTNMYYLTLENGAIFLDSNKKAERSILLQGMAKTKLFSIKKGVIEFHPTVAVKPSVTWERISLAQGVFLTQGQQQVALRLVDYVNLEIDKKFKFDKNFYKQASKVVASLVVHMIFTFVITMPEPKEMPKPKAITATFKVLPKNYKLYEPPKPKVASAEAASAASEVSAEVLTSKTVNTGVKDTVQPNHKTEFAQGNAKKQVVAKAQAPGTSGTAPALPPKPGYSFNSKTIGTNNLVGSAPNIANSNGPSAIVTGSGGGSGTSFNAGSADVGEIGTGSGVGISKFNGNGSDSRGNGSASYGSRGLASKSGFDSSYLEPKTVVLGSMDPEVLRTILREYIGQFRSCYQQELIEQSDKISGVIDLNFTISAAGRVEKYDIRAKGGRGPASGTLFSKKGINCMGQVLSIIPFPKPKGGGVVDVKQPLNFFAETQKI
jgi:pSer/pThr/pTyr-binding forkhead associated (FHA) protein